MLLLVAATEIEMGPFRSVCKLPDNLLNTFISGVGPLEAAVSLTRTLERSHHEFTGVVNFGVAGAYLPAPGSTGAEILDICLASCEKLGDYGVCLADEIELFADHSLAGSIDFPLDQGMLEQARRILDDENLPYITGTFVTVNGCSGTAARGEQLRRRFGALCENMEGASIARVCREYSLPLLEVRAVSNLVEDRPGTPWKLKEACLRAARAASLIVEKMAETV